ncbi:MAG: hypothetical protein ABIG63_20955 [Chloroflexota bacterium]
MDAPRKRILIIDARDDWLSTIKSALEDNEYAVSRARNLADAQKVILAEGNAFDLIVTDQLQAESSKQDLQDLIWIEPDRRRRVVILFNTEPTLQKMRKIFKLGVYDCLTKFDEPEEILKLIQETTR